MELGGSQIQQNTKVCLLIYIHLYLQGDGNMIEGGVVSPIIITTQRKSLCQLYGLLEKDKEANPPVEQHGQYAMV